MGQDISTETASQAPARQSLVAEQSREMLRMIADAVQNPAVDVAKMQALLQMQREIKADNAFASYTAAFMAMSEEMPSISKKGAILNKQGQVQSRYAKWEDIDRIIRPILARHGFAISFRVDSSPNGVMTVEAVLAHVDGHVERSGAMPLPIDASGGKNNVQGAGSTLSYGKRFTAIAILNIRTEDDTDGAIVQQQSLGEEKGDLVQQSREAAAKGTDFYVKWYQDLAGPDRRDLVQSGVHAENKERAALGPDYKPPRFPGDE